MLRRRLACLASPCIIGAGLARFVRVEVRDQVSAFYGFGVFTFSSCMRLRKAPANVTVVLKSGHTLERQRFCADVVISRRLMCV